MAGERVRVVLERSGGVVGGRPLRRGLDTDELPEDTASQLRDLAAAVAAPPGAAQATRGASGGTNGRADRFAYTLEVDGPDGRTVRTFSEPVPDDVRPLVELMRKAPLLPARRDAR